MIETEKPIPLKYVTNTVCCVRSTPDGKFFGYAGIEDGNLVFVSSERESSLEINCSEITEMYKREYLNLTGFEVYANGKGYMFLMKKDNVKSLVSAIAQLSGVV